MRLWMKTQKGLPAVRPEAEEGPLRGDQYGAPHTRAELLAWAEEGSYFKACNPTLGTGIAMGIQVAFSDTANVLALLRNGSPSKAVIPHYLRLICTAAGASTTAAHLGIVTDTANRYTSGGSDLLASIANANSEIANVSIVDVLRFGAVTAAAAVAKRQLARSALKTQAAPCWAVGDEVLINFLHQAGIGGHPRSGAAANFIEIPVGPVALKGQNHSLLVHQWNVANATTPPSWEVELAWWER